jgi:hypothetical protein
MVVLFFLLIVEQYPLLQSIQDDLPSDARTFPGSPSAAASGAGETVLVKHGMRVKSPHRWAFQAAEKLGLRVGREFIPGLNAMESTWFYRLRKNTVNEGYRLHRLRKNSVLYQGTTLVVP